MTLTICGYVPAGGAQRSFGEGACHRVRRHVEDKRLGYSIYETAFTLIGEWL